MSGSPAAAGEPAEPPFFRDLNDLVPFFRAPLPDAAAVRYRHEVLRDLEKPETAGAVTTFADRMRAVRDSLAQSRKLRYRYQKESWF